MWLVKKGLCACMRAPLTSVGAHGERTATNQVTVSICASEEPRAARSSKLGRPTNEPKTGLRLLREVLVWLSVDFLQEWTDGGDGAWRRGAEEVTLACDAD